MSLASLRSGLSRTRPRLSSVRFALLAAASCGALAFACGGISDPTKDGEKVATVSGSLTGTSVPAGARVALVWRTASSSIANGGYAVGDDVAVVDGKFSMSLAVPSAAYFSPIDDSGSFNSGTVDVPPSTGTGTGSGGTAVGSSSGSTSSTSSSGGSTSGSPARAGITPRDNASGTIITNPLTGAVAGFVVYVDTNGNGKLDLSGQYAASTDTILGGNRELVLAYLKDGGALDYEKLRDTSGILPASGFNLAWTNKQRWLPLSEVELQLSASQGLPSPVCSTSGTYSGGSGGTAPLDPVTPTEPSSSSSGSSGAPTPTPVDGGPVDLPDSGTATDPNAYPLPGDPNLKCSPDGLSYSYSYPTPDCPPSPPAPVGLCAGDATNIGIACATPGGYGAVIPSGSKPPVGWPCPIPPAVDGGSAPDGG